MLPSTLNVTITNIKENLDVIINGSPKTDDELTIEELIMLSAVQNLRESIARYEQTTI